MKAFEIDNHFVRSGKEIRFFFWDAVDFHTMPWDLKQTQKNGDEKINNFQRFCFLDIYLMKTWWFCATSVLFYFYACIV